MVKQTGILAFILYLAAASGTAHAQLPADQMISYKLGTPQPHWAYILDSVFMAPTVSKVHIVDLDSEKLLGEVDGGLYSNFEYSPDGREFYSIDTFYSRAWHGTRFDAVTIFDAGTLLYKSEIPIPPKRIMIVPKINSTGITPDGRFLMVFNLTPATSISVVDLKKRKFAGEIETGGCVQVLIAGNRKFASMCPDGSLLTVELDETGKVQSRKQSKPFFDPNQDPVFDQPVVVGAKAYFDSYRGQLYPVDLSGDTAQSEGAWPLTTDDDKKANWRPGGWLSIAASEKGDSLYVLMHQGGEWTHKQPGKEVWVYDTTRKTRIDRIALKTEGYSIRVSRGANPILESIALVQSQLETYTVPEGKYLGVYKDIGTSFLVTGP
jgi:methylamine dehydrogenase heavy chain